MKTQLRAAAGHPLGRLRITQPMRGAELSARTHRPFRPCIRASRGEIGHGDIASIRITAGWRYLAVWIDLFSRGEVRWTLDQRMDADLLVGALKLTLGHRQR